MEQGWFTILLVKPLYNALIYLVDIIPGAYAGIAVVLVTILVKIVLYPLSKKAIETQIKMKHLEGDMNSIKDKHKNNKEEQAKAMMGLYKDKKVNPFSSIFLLFVQLPIIFALYKIFFQNALPAVDETLLYSFVQAPTYINMMFLGFIDLSGKSLLFAILAGISQYFQAKFSLASLPDQANTPKKDEKPSFQVDFAKSMSLQMRYVLPVITLVISYQISAVVALYWFVSNLWAVGQELLVRRRLIVKHALPPKL